jgi:hypothetical protein
VPQIAAVIPLAWHRRHALLIASQLPENACDARLVVQAVAELLKFLEQAPEPEVEFKSNIVSFTN